MDSLSLHIIWTTFFIYFHSQIFNATASPSNQNNLDDIQVKIRCNCSTNIDIRKAEYIWTINNFSSIENVITHYRSSASFFDDKNEIREWYLRLYPNGNNCKNNTIALLLRVKQKDGRVFDASIAFEASILNNKYEEVWSLKNNTVHKFTLGDWTTAWEMDDFLKKDQFFRDHLLQNDTLILKVKFWCCLQNQSMNSVSNKQPHTTTSSPESNTIENDLAKNLESLFENPLFNDVQISVNGKTLYAHKSILAARCPFFADLFSRTRATDNFGRTLVTITDMDEEVTSEVLRYIYTGKCNNLTKLAKDLLLAANKFALTPLKKICSEALSKTLSVENAADLLVLADTHGADELKSQVIEFIANRPNEILDTAAWKSMVQPNPNTQLLNEVCQALATRDSQGNNAKKCVVFDLV